MCTNNFLLDLDLNIDFIVKPNIKVIYISFEDVKEVLEEVEDGYFNFIGSTREKELNELDNDYLTSHIFSLNTYSGFFELNKDY